MYVAAGTHLSFVYVVAQLHAAFLHQHFRVSFQTKKEVFGKCSVSKTGLHQPRNAFTAGCRSQPSIKAIINSAVLNVP